MGLSNFVLNGARKITAETNGDLKVDKHIMPSSRLPKPEVLMNYSMKQICSTVSIVDYLKVIFRNNCRSYNKTTVFTKILIGLQDK